MKSKKVLEIRGRHSKSKLLVAFFNLFGITGQIPFSVHQNDYNGTHYLTSSTFKRFVSAVLQGTAVLIQVTLTVASGFLDYQNGSLIGNASEILNSIFGVVYVCLAIDLLWNRKEKLVQVFECTRTNIQHGKLIRHIPSGLLILSCCYVCFMTYEHLVLRSNVHFLPLRNGTIFDILSRNCISQSKNLDGGCTWGIWALYLLLKLILFILSYSSTFFMFNHFFFLLLALSMLDLAKEFRQNLAQIKEVHKGIELYLDMKMKAKVVNDCIAPMILCYYLSVTSFLIEGPEILMGFKDAAPSEKVVYGLCIGSAITWVLFAEYHEKVKNAIENWLALEHKLLFTSFSVDNGSLETRMKLMTLMSEVDKGSLTISCKYFAITNRFLSSSLGLLVTYVIVSLQMQPKRNM